MPKPERWLTFDKLTLLSDHRRLRVISYADAAITYRTPWDFSVFVTETLIGLRSTCCESQFLAVRDSDDLSCGACRSVVRIGANSSHDFQLIAFVDFARDAPHTQLAPIVSKLYEPLEAVLVCAEVEQELNYVGRRLRLEVKKFNAVQREYYSAGLFDWRSV